MAKESVICALEGCEESFVPKVHNQRYHSKACCRIYTNARILEQYHQKKNKKMTGRTCSQRGCKTRLSQYNEGTKCAIHERKDYIKKLQKWGWKVDPQGGDFS